MDYDSVVNTVAAGGTVIALIFGIRAYSVAQHANRIAAEQGRRTFELEILRELHNALHARADAILSSVRKDGEEGTKQVWLAYLRELVRLRAQLSLIPADELGTWWHLGSMPPPDEDEMGWVRSYRAGKPGRSAKGIAFDLYRELEEELLAAIKKRMS